jgi:hypothetical protein
MVGYDRRSEQGLAESGIDVIDVIAGWMRRRMFACNPNAYKE